VYDTSVTLNNLGRFKCEDSYYYLGSYTTVTNGYMKKRHSYAPDKKVNGGSISVNQCAYYYEYKYWSSVANSRTRVSELLRYRAVNASMVGLRRSVYDCNDAISRRQGDGERSVPSSPVN
jgi:hypothetical protein